MNGFDLLLLGGILGMLIVVLLRPQTLVVPPVVTPVSESSGCLLPLAFLGLLLLGLLLLGGKPA